MNPFVLDAPEAFTKKGEDSEDCIDLPDKLLGRVSLETPSACQDQPGYCMDVKDCAFPLAVSPGDSKALHVLAPYALLAIEKL